MKNQTLREIAVSRPGATSVFLAHGLDFCCGGARPLGEACRDIGLDPVEVEMSILAADPGPTDLTRLTDLPVAELTSLIEARYHARLRTEFPELMALADKVERVHGEKASCPKGLGRLLRDMHEATLDHLAKEEQILFPMIRSGYGAHATGPVQVMEREHEDHGRALGQLNELTSGFVPPAEACTTWKALYLRLKTFSDEFMEHIHVENNILFPRALCEGVEA
jgi:regulator of cell morphogenesis and NO signaling